MEGMFKPVRMQDIQFEKDEESFHIYQKDGQDAHLEEGEFDNLFLPVDSEEEVEERLKEWEDEHSDKFVGWKKRWMSVVKETKHTTIERTVFAERQLEPAFEEPLEADWEEKAVELEEKFEEKPKDWRSDSSPITDIDGIQELVGAKIVGVGWRKEVEGGLALDYEQDGVTKRIVLGFTDLGMWSEWQGEL